MALADELRFLFNRLSFSYVFDWVIIVIFLAIAAAFSIIEPFKRDFSLTDDHISFPYNPDTISIPVLFVVAVVAPAFLIALICVILVRVPDKADRSNARALLWRRKLWELHAGWLGLALSLTLSLFLTQTMKNMFGKHRPDFLSRCDPDVAQMNNFVSGGFTSEFLEGTSVLVTWEICKSKDGGAVSKSEFLDGFRSFPSGHCTVAFAGLTYLTLFLAAKFSASIPFLSPAPQTTATPDSVVTRASKARHETAAPPLYLLVLVLAPVCAAIYIASTRFTDYKHAGFDIIFGSVEGAIVAWFAFRWYHLPVRRGAGWAWGPRGQDTAFGIRVGTGSYSGARKGKKRDDNPEPAVGPLGGNMELQDVSRLGQTANTEGSYESQRELL